MHIALVLLVAATLTLLDSRVEADFWYNQPTPNAEQIKARGLKCIPGRTVIEIGQVKADDQDESDEARRTHTNTKTNDESCKICVCSTEGKDVYCSKRPARNVNECIRLSLLKKRLQSSMPFEHERSLSFRIRRVGEDNINDTKCIPFVSEYSDCTEANYCSGCNRCKCNASAQWECKEVLMCPGSEEEDPDRDTIVTNIDNIQKYIELKNKEKKPRTLVPPPLNDKDDLIGYIIAIPR